MIKSLRVCVSIGLLIKCIENNFPTLVENINRDRARILIEELIRHADKEVFIQCSHFCKDVYTTEVAQLLEDAVNRKCVVEIAIRAEKISLADGRLANLGNHYQLNQHIFENDFCVVDGKRYRVETDPQTRAAVACAFGENIAQKLRTLFLQNYRPEKAH